MSVYILDIEMTGRFGKFTVKFSPMFTNPYNLQELMKAAEQLDLSPKWLRDDRIFFLTKSKKKQAKRLGIAEIVGGDKGRKLYVEMMKQQCKPGVAQSGSAGDAS